MRDFDYGKLRDIKWDSEILGLVAQIHEYKGKQALYLKQKPATLEKLVEVAKYYHCVPYQAIMRAEDYAAEQRRRGNFGIP